MIFYEPEEKWEIWKRWETKIEQVSIEFKKWLRQKLRDNRLNEQRAYEVGQFAKNMSHFQGMIALRLLLPTIYLGIIKDGELILARNPLVPENVSNVWMKNWRLSNLKNCVICGEIPPLPEIKIADGAKEVVYTEGELKKAEKLASSIRSLTLPEEIAKKFKETSEYVGRRVSWL